jgi:hypothetical protein
MSPDEDKPMAQAVKNSTSDPLLVIDVLAYKKDESGKNYWLCSRFIDF